MRDKKKLTDIANLHFSNQKDKQQDAKVGHANRKYVFPNIGTCLKVLTKCTAKLQLLCIIRRYVVFTKC